MIHYYLKNTPDTSTTVSLKIMDAAGELIKDFSTEYSEKEDDLGKAKLEASQGFNTFNWDMRYPDALGFDGLILWGGGLNGPKAVPGEYKAVLSVNGQEQEQNFRILADPRWDAAPADLQAQFDFLISVRDKLTETHEAINNIREIRSQINTVVEKVKGDESKQDIVDLAKNIDKQITQIEQELYQTKNRSNQDPLNYPIKLNNKLANVGSQVSYGNFRPTKQAFDFKNEITRQIDQQLKEYREVVNEELPRFNQLVQQKNVSAVSLKEKEEMVNP
jgi:hypothetical protein